MKTRPGKRFAPMLALVLALAADLSCSTPVLVGPDAAADAFLNGCGKASSATPCPPIDEKTGFFELEPAAIELASPLISGPIVLVSEGEGWNIEKGIGENVFCATPTGALIGLSLALEAKDSQKVAGYIPKIVFDSHPEGFPIQATLENLAFAGLVKKAKEAAAKTPAEPKVAETKTGLYALLDLTTARALFVKEDGCWKLVSIEPLAK
jgi:hypothetical protein